MTSHRLARTWRSGVPDRDWLSTGTAAIGYSRALRVVASVRLNFDAGTLETLVRDSRTAEILGHRPPDVCAGCKIYKSNLRDCADPIDKI